MLHRLQRRRTRTCCPSCRVVRMLSFQPMKPSRKQSMMSMLMFECVAFICSLHGFFLLSVYICCYYYPGLPVVLKFLNFNRCPEIVLKLASVLKFYSFGQNVLIWTFVMLSLRHSIRFVLYLVSRTFKSTFGLLTYLLHFCLSMFITVS